MSNLIYISETFCRTEAYNAAVLNCYAFRRGTDVRNGIVLSLGNMVSGYPFEIEGIRFENSECAYIAGAFSLGTPQHLALQHQLTVCTNALWLRESEKRADWESCNVEWMKFVVWQKCLGNSDFRKLLLSLPNDAVIIEDSTFQVGRTATVWGTRNDELKKRLNALRKELKAQGMCKAAIKREQDKRRLGEWATIGVFKGKNIMGKILMACKQALEQGTEPPIDYVLLQESHINLLGKKLTFNQYVKAA